MDDVPLGDLVQYRIFVGSIQYLTFTRPDLSFALNYVSQFMNALPKFHFSLVKRTPRFIKHALDFGHHIVAKSVLNLSAFLKSDWAGCPFTRRSTT